ncbi:MAG: ATP synthase F1 subunit epsilon [Christensenellaceae bacterium]|jgi:F-type H+-transporting ATPase subunit epsilon|nr:ATP synthase F1 subunit epsilon [Christensenellaceae bacterium]
MPGTFHLTVLTPKHSFFDDDAKQIIIEAEDGQIGILPGHQPMVVSMVEGLLRIQRKDGTWHEAAVSSGFATVLQDEIDVLLQTAEWAENIDAARAREAIRVANESLRQQKSIQEYHMARTMLARAMVRLRITSRVNHD